MRWCILLIMAVLLHANPILVEVINEFQVAPYDSERVELRYLQSSAHDTAFVETFPLINVPVGTPTGQAFINANIYLTGMDETVVDRSVLSGNFALPEDSGFIFIEIWPGGDSIYYPGHATTWRHAPAPPPYASAAKFHCYAYDAGFLEYWLIADWYIDPTPTFGAPNDDYPGCLVAGRVYDQANQPLAGARVTATVDYSAFLTFPAVEYRLCCTTYTAVDGAYHLDSLLPFYYHIDVHAEGYLPDTQGVGLLCCTDPITDLDFHLPTGIAEHNNIAPDRGPHVWPNPFKRELRITMPQPLPVIDIYDVTGALMRRVANEALKTVLTVDCAGLPPGIYFVGPGKWKAKVIKF